MKLPFNPIARGPRIAPRPSVTGTVRVADGGHRIIAIRNSPALVLTSVLRWYFGGRQAGAQSDVTLPFYCDPKRVGAFAAAPDALAAGKDVALFRVFIALSMYQALRDVVIMRQQRSMPRAAVRVVADVTFVRQSVVKHPCTVLRSADAFEEDCDVSKDGHGVDCARCPGIQCHVKDATLAFNRMGDMGKLPTSAFLRVWRRGGMRRMLAEVCNEEVSPTARASRLVERFTQVHRVGRKLATMFVSAMSTPALSPGLTPWFPDIDGNELIVVDTNVARAVDILRKPSASKSYDVRESWLREQSASQDLRTFRPDLPSYSPRLVQQALYAFCSKSNRIAAGDACAIRSTPCPSCAPALCPFLPKFRSARSI
jgi:hypothetical protein